MIIIGQRTGQLGNRLLLFAHFIANALECGGEVLNPSFYDYATYFENTNTDFFCRFPVRPGLRGQWKFLRRLFYLFVRAAIMLGKVLPSNHLLKVLNISASATGQEYDLAQPEFQKLRQASRFLIVHGWPYRDHRALWKNRRAVREYFGLVPKHRTAVEAVLQKARVGADVLVGVHIRQGDYQQWHQGEFYFETPIYAQFMQACVNLFPGKTVKFLICSNTSQDEKYFSGFNYLFGTQHLVEDMYAFAGCDYLIGPPSTFTAWASYYGEVPLCRLRSTIMDLALPSFSVYGYRAE